MAIPPPDKPYELPLPVSALNVRVHILGYIDSEEDVEIQAVGDGRIFRFYVAKTSRIVRKFWQHIGVTNVLKLQDGAYESKHGMGPFNLTGIALGEDEPQGGDLPEGEEPISTQVLIAVQVEG